MLDCSTGRLWFSFSIFRPEIILVMNWMASAESIRWNWSWKRDNHINGATSACASLDNGTNEYLWDFLFHISLIGAQARVLIHLAIYCTMNRTNITFANETSAMAMRRTRRRTKEKRSRKECARTRSSSCMNNRLNQSLRPSTSPRGNPKLRKIANRINELEKKLLLFAFDVGIKSKHTIAISSILKVVRCNHVRLNTHRCRAADREMEIFRTRQNRY